MKKIYVLALAMLVFVAFTSAQQLQSAGKAVKKNAAITNIDKAKELDLKKEAMELEALKADREIAPSTGNAQSFVTETKAMWDILKSFSVNSASQQAIATDGQYFYTAKWNSGDFCKYDLNGNFISTFTIPGVSGVRDFAYDGTYFYVTTGASSIYKLNLSSGTPSLVSTITLTGSTNAARHIAYDPTANGGAGGFWVGAWSDLYLVSMTGAKLLGPYTVNSVYGSAYDNVSAGGPYLWLFSQTQGTSTNPNNLVNIQQWKISTTSFTGVAHTAEDLPGFIQGTSTTQTIAGGAEGSTLLYPGKYVLMVNVQQSPNLVGVYEIATTAPTGSPNVVTNLTAVADTTGAPNVKVSWKNPSITAGGAPLTDLDSVVVFNGATIVGKVINPVIGADTFVNVVLDTGSFTLKVQGFNDAGAGLPTTVTLWVGPDVPAAVTNLTLTNVNGNAQLTWTNPTTGLHNGLFKQSWITGYTITRSDAQVFTVTGLATQFNQSISTIGTYTYTVVPNSIFGNGGSATSNAQFLGAVGVQVGNENNLPTASPRPPLDFYWKNSLCEVMYYPAELNFTGLITHIGYFNNFSSNLTNKPVKIWIGHTDNNNLSAGYIPSTELTQVFDGNVNFPNGQNMILIPLSTPFLYNGTQKLVVMTNRPMDSQYFSSSDKFYITNAPGANRCIMDYSDNTTYNPAAPPAVGTNLRNYFPNTLFLYTPLSSGIKGKVTNAVTTNPIQNATVSIIGTSVSTTTNDTGFYKINRMPGTYMVKAEAFGFYADSASVIVLADSMHTLNFQLTPMPKVSVSGVVRGNDNPNVGLANAIVKLEGYANYIDTTDANGVFSFANVWANKTYTIKVTRSGYNDYTASVNVGATNMVLDTITLSEVIVAPFGLQVTTTGLPTGQAKMTWNNLTSHEIFQHDGTIPANPNAYYQYFGRGYGVVYDLSTYQNVTIEAIDFHHMLWGLTPATFQYKVHVVNATTGAVLGVVGPLNTTVNDNWELDVDLGSIDANGVAQVGIYIEPLSNSATDAYPCITADNTGPQGASGFVTLPNYTSVTASTVGDFFIDLWISASNKGQLVKVSKVNVNKANDATRKPALAVNSDHLLTNQAFNTISFDNKAFLGYNVYVDGGITTNTPIATGIDTNYYLLTGLSVGSHTAGVRAIYTSGQSAMITKTFEIVQTFDVTFTVTSGGNPLQGATVALTGYGTQTTNASGVAVFTAVVSSSTPIAYTVTKTGYVTVNGTVLVNGNINQPVNMNPQPYNVTFTVRNSANQAISGASVLVTGFPVQTTNASGQTVFQLTNGTYTYKVWATNYDTATGNFTVNNANLPVNVVLIGVGVAEMSAVNGFTMYPNPVKDMLYINSETMIDNIKVVDMLGNVVYQGEVNSKAVKVNTAAYQPGLYLIYIESKQQLYIKKIQIVK